MCSGRIVDLDAVKGLDILFHVYLLRMLDVVLNSLDHHRQNVTLGIIGQADQRHPVELKLVSRTELHSDDKWFVEPYKVYLNLVWLMGEVGTGAGDVAGGAEFRPTDAELLTLTELERQLAAAKAAFDALLKTELPAFNRAMSGKIAPIAESQP